MGRYVIRRVLSMPALLLAIITVAFVISHTVAGDPLSTILSQRAMGDPAEVAAAKARWGLDKSLPQQYFAYLDQVIVHGDLGTSFETKSGVLGDLASRLPASLELALFALVVAVFFGVPIGIYSAVRQNRSFDYGGRVFALVGSSVPVYWSGVILIVIFSVQLHWLPSGGRLDPRALPPPHHTGFYTIDSILAGNPSLFWDAFTHLLLPAFVLGWGVMGIVSRIVRGSMLEVLTQDYIRTARAKGVRESVVLVRHAFRNALIPAMTIVGFSAAYLITGAVLVEIVFSWPGIGTYAVQSAESLDFPAIMGVCLLGGAAFLLANFVTDLGYALADPQIRLA